MIVGLNNECHYPLAKGEYFIYDDNENNKPLFLNENDLWNLKIVNSSQINVDFFQNDGCLMALNDLKKCDWVLAFKNEFYFIEAKDVKLNQRKKQRKDAVEKFEATIPFFIEKYKVINDMNFHVVINFRSNKLTSSADKARILYFDEKYGANYIETNYLDFK